MNPNYISIYLDEVIRLVADFVTSVPYMLVTEGVFDAMEELKAGWGDEHKVSSGVIDILLKMKEPFVIMSTYDSYLSDSPRGEMISVCVS